MCDGTDKINICMVVVVLLVVGKYIHKTSNIEYSRVVKQCIICDDNNIEPASRGITSDFTIFRSHQMNNRAHILSQKSCELLHYMEEVTEKSI